MGHERGWLWGSPHIGRREGGERAREGGEMRREGAIGGEGGRRGGERGARGGERGFQTRGFGGSKQGVAHFIQSMTA